MALTNKQQVFVQEYLRCFNATEAARLAGYKFPNVEGPKNLVNPSIAEFIKAAIAEKMMSADEVLQRLADHARGTMADFIDVQGETLDLAKAEKAGKLHLIKKFTRTTGRYGISLSIELYDAQAALEKIGKHHRLFSDVNLNVDLSKLTEEQLERLAAGEDPAKVVAS